MFRKGWICVCLVLIAFVIMGCAGTPESVPEPVPSEPEEVVTEEVEAKVAVEAGSSLAIRKSPGIKNKPEVEDTSTGISGWSVSQFFRSC